MSGIASEGMPGAICTIARGCGPARTSGGLYWELGITGENGVPIEDFFVDPPIAVDPAALGVTPQGTHLIQDTSTGTYHLLDMVGVQHYRMVADFLEESRRFGISRRIAVTQDLAKLTPESRLILIHARGYLRNASAYLQPEDGSGFDGCPCEKPEHAPARLASCPMCIGALWECLDDGIPVQGDERRVLRPMPWGAYPARLDPPGVSPVFIPAIVARFPIGRWAVVEDKDGGSHQRALSALAAAGHTGVVVEH